MISQRVIMKDRDGKAFLMEDHGAGEHDDWYAVSDGSDHSVEVVIFRGGDSDDDMVEMYDRLVPSDPVGVWPVSEIAMLPTTSVDWVEAFAGHIGVVETLRIVATKVT